jgi:hemolysin III
MAGKTGGATPVEYSNSEEIVSSITHGVGVGLGAAGLIVLVTLAGLAGDGWRVVSFSIYGATLVLLYLSSLLYHSVRTPRAKRFFRYFDHASIFLLIAGTYTPFTLISLRGWWGWALFALIWIMAITGIVLTFVLMDRSRLLAGILYITMGWLVIIAVKPLLNAVPRAGVLWLLAGGLAYTFGVVFYLWKRLPFNHAIWHLFVLAGSICHFCAVYLYVLPA